MKKLKCVLAVVLSVCGGVRAGEIGAPVVFVDDDAVPGGDGASWSTAYRSLQDALAAVRAGGVAVEVRVAQGVYKADDGAGIVKGDREVSFALDVAVTVRGGYAGVGAADPDARDVKGYVTTLSGDLAGDDAPGFVNRAENTKRVVVMSAASGEAVLEGVVVRGGEQPEFGSQCGGIVQLSGSTQLSECTIVDCRGFDGGGLSVLDGVIRIHRCEIRENQAIRSGGGIGGYGGTDPVITVTSSRIVKNISQQGGGVFLAFGEPTITFVSCLIDRNKVVHPFYWTIGGGVVVSPSNRATFWNCVIYENEAPTGTGGGLACILSLANIRNCTIYGNRDIDGVSLQSNVLSGSSGLPGTSINLIEDYAEPLASNTWRVIEADPGFVDPDGPDNVPGNADDDFRLSANSPAIDAGYVLPSMPDGGVDADGMPRVVDDPTRPNTPLLTGSLGPIDLGMYEYQADCDSNGIVDSVDLLAVPELDCDGNGVVDSCEEFADCNLNGVNDRCELSTSPGLDCNGNGVPDVCDIATGLSLDVDGNSTPDECQPVILRVDRDAEGMGNGTTWQHAMTSVTHALDVAANRPGTTEIWVAEGVYRPGAAGERNAAFDIPPRTSIYGGFAGTEELRAERDPAVNVVVWSGDLNGNDLPGTDPTSIPGPPDRADNAASVVRVRHGVSAIVVDGVSIRDGHADGLLSGGIVFTTSTGGGDRVSSGGVHAAVGSRALFENCTFERNHANGEGGVSNGLLNFRGCYFRSNTAAAGGALVVGGGVEIEHCTFVENRVRSGASDGGALMCAGANSAQVSVVAHCRFLKNSALNGGAVSLRRRGTIVLFGCLFAGNSAQGSGGGLASITQNPVAVELRGCQLLNSTFVGNSAGSGGGAVINAGGPGSISNNVFWGNQSQQTDPANAELVLSNASALTFESNCIRWYAGTPAGNGNIGLDPMFVDANGADDVYGTEDDDIRLMPGSPCIDAGNNDAIPAVIQAPVMVDLLGNPRFADDPSTPDTGVGVAPIIDIGAVEFVPAPPPECAGDVNGDGMTDGRDLSVFLAGFGAPVSPGTGADVNGDGLVDGRDLSVFLANFGCGG